MKSISLRSLTALAILAAPAAAQGVLPYLPKGTMMAVSAPDLAMSMAEFRQMPLAKMWAEEEVQTFFADVLEMAKEKVDEAMGQAREMHAQGMLPVNPDDLMKLRLNGGTFAITHLEMTQGDFGPMPKFGFVVHLDFGQSAPTWNALIELGLGMMQSQAGDEVERKDEEIGGVKLMSFAATDAPGMEMGLNIAMVPNGILIGTLAEDVRSIVANMQSKTLALGASESFATATKRLDTTGAECEMYMAPNPMVDFAMSALRMATEMEPDMAVVDMDGIERAMQAMGMRDLGSTAMTASYVDGKSVTRTFHTHGKSGTAANKTVDTSFLRWVPKDAVSFSSGTLDISSFYDTIVKGLQAYDSKFAEQAMAQLAEMEKQLGFSIRNDLFGSLGDHYISWSMPMGTISSAPEVAFLMKVNDEEKLVSALKNLAALTQGMVAIEEGEKRGLKAYQVQVNFDPTGGMGGINPFDMLQPTFAFNGGYMVMGFSASDVKRVFKRMEREDDPKGDIRSNKEFAAIADSIPAGVSSISFTDWKANFESFYQLATGVLAFMPMPEDVPIDMSLLPDSETLTRHLFAAVSYTKTDAEGTETVDVSPFGAETWLVLGAAVGAAAGAGTMMTGRIR